MILQNSIDESHKEDSHTYFMYSFIITHYHWSHDKQHDDHPIAMACVIWEKFITTMMRISLKNGDGLVVMSVIRFFMMLKN